MAMIAKISKTLASTEYVDEKLSGLSAAQPDWNQNDETAADYIKNRPFYTTDPVEIVLVEETTVSGFEQINDTTMTATLWKEFDLQIGQSYIVIYDGIRYEDLICFNDKKDNNDFIYYTIGSSYNDNFTNYPFRIVVSDDYEYPPIYTNDLVNTTHNFTIIAKVPEAIQIDEKYISYKPGLKTEGNTYIITDDEGTESEVTAGVGAEIFNDYENNKAIGKYSHAEGAGPIASGNFSHAEGSNTTSSGESSHAEGVGTTASGYASHAEGAWGTASGSYSHAEGSSTASGAYSHAEGIDTVASGHYSHAEGSNTTSSGQYSHAEGIGTVASGDFSHAEGASTIASGDNQHVQGKYNIEDTANKYVHIVGNGEYSTPSNAHTLDWNGNAEFAGDVVAYGCGGSEPISLVALNEKVNSGGGGSSSDYKIKKVTALPETPEPNTIYIVIE